MAGPGLWRSRPDLDRLEKTKYSYVHMQVLVPALMPMLVLVPVSILALELVLVLVPILIWH